MALFKEGNLLAQHYLTDATPAQCLDQLSILGWTYARSIYSGVGQAAFYEALKPHLHDPLFLTPDTPVPFRSVYKTPGSWGMDRKALVAAAYRLYPGQDVLLIDAGSCVTCDFLNREGVYEGGSISPGLYMRAKAMHAFTARLPLIEPEQEVALIGTDTVGSLQSGAVNGFKAEVGATIQAYESRYPGMITLLTGGDLAYLAGMVKNSIFAAPDLIVQGLNFILEDNA